MLLFLTSLILHGYIIFIGFSLQRRWQNQLGSVMIIDNVNSDTGDFSGQYCSSVGQAENFYRLTGRYDTAPANGTPTLGWTVTWKNSFKNAPPPPRGLVSISMALPELQPCWQNGCLLQRLNQLTTGDQHWWGLMSLLQVLKFQGG